MTGTVVKDLIHSNKVKGHNRRSVQDNIDNHGNIHEGKHQKNHHSNSNHGYEYETDHDYMNYDLSGNHMTEVDNEDMNDKNNEVKGRTFEEGSGLKQIFEYQQNINENIDDFQSSGQESEMYSTHSDWEKLVERMYVNPETYRKYEDSLHTVLRDPSKFKGRFTLAHLNLIKHPGMRSSRWKQATNNVVQLSRAINVDTLNMNTFVSLELMAWRMMRCFNAFRRMMRCFNAFW